MIEFLVGLFVMVILCIPVGGEYYSYELRCHRRRTVFEYILLLITSAVFLGVIGFCFYKLGEYILKLF